MEVREWEEIQIVIPRTENGVKPEAGESEQLFGMAHGWIWKLDRFSL